MSSQYPVLDNRPIDQWKVTELKEELKRRKLATKGLKEELVKRLDEAIRNDESETSNGFDPDTDVKNVIVEAEEVVEDENVKIVDVEGGTDGSIVATVDNAVYVETTETGNESAKDSGFDEKNDIEEDATPKPEPNNQVPEVSVGFQVKCESISTDSVSINEKNELKVNLNADNFHLEIEVGKPEMVVQPSSGSVPPVVGDVHTLDDDKVTGKDQVSLGEVDAEYATSVELSKNEDNVGGGGSPEKINLDKSSGDESMEEDVLESKHVESNSKSGELVERVEVNKTHDADEGTPVNVMAGNFALDNKDIVVEEKMEQVAPIEKRKVEDHEVVKTNDNSKRQRRWNPEPVKVSELQSSNISSSTTPKDAFQPKPKRTFARSDSTLSAESPKERVVPPSQKPATNSLRIDRFLRPFTLKAVQELLAKTGTVCKFWIDQIKTHCYVTYSSVEEAATTRDAVYNLQWPPNGGRCLVAEFVDPQEVKARVEAPPQLPVPISPSPTPTAPTFQPQALKPSRQHDLRQQLPSPLPLPPPPPLADPPSARERLPPPPPPPPQKIQEPPVMTLDDLFKKTKTTPRIYYLPLSDELVATKLAAQGKTSVE